MVEKYVVPNCPICGRFMDKVRAEVKEQLREGKSQVGDIVIAWVCTNPECQKELKS